eukprot:m.269263 g.269263  ORF g.269263 m.269263 type:complete len:1965 (-) comp26830_c0_seq2:1544-7438(-)
MACVISPACVMRAALFMLILGPVWSQPAPPPPGGSFQSATLLVTQESLTKAPEKYPEIVQQVKQGVAEAQAQLIPFKDSGNLFSCGNATTLAKKWQMYTNETVKIMNYVNNSIGTEILGDGVLVSATVNTSFVTPVWLGICAWTEVLAKNPKVTIVTAVLDAVTEVMASLKGSLLTLLGTATTDDRTGSCDIFKGGFKSEVAIYGNDASVTIAFDNTSLRFAPATDPSINGFEATGDFTVDVSVPVYYKIWEGWCLCCSTSCGPSPLHASASVTLSVLVECDRCAIKKEISSIKYTPTVTLLHYESEANCDELLGHDAGLLDKINLLVKPAIKPTTEAGLYVAFGSLTEQQQRVTCGCVEICPTGSNINGSFITELHTTLSVAENAGNIIVTGNRTNATVPNITLSVCENCPSATFYGQGPVIQAAIVSATQTAVSTEMSQEAKSFNVPVVIQPFPSHPIFYEYFLENVTFVADQNITASSFGVLYATAPNGTNITFTNYDAAESLLLPPETPWLTQASTDAPPLNGLRLSTTGLNGVADLADILGYFRDGFNVSILGANLLFNVSFERPHFSVADDTFLQLYLPQGVFAVTCLNRCGGNISNGFGNMMLLNFQNITAQTLLSVVQNETQIGVVAKIQHFDFNDTGIQLVHPQFPLPQAFLQRLLQDSMTKEIPKANRLLANNPVYLSENISRLLYNPSISIASQSQCCKNWTHGYIEIGDYLQAGAIQQSDVFASDRRRHVSTAPTDGATYILSLYTSSVSLNAACSLSRSGDTVSSVPLQDTSGVCTTSTSGDYSYALSTTLDGHLNLTFSDVDNCQFCIVCNHILTTETCYSTESSDSVANSFALTANTMITWSPGSHTLEGLVDVVTESSNVSCLTSFLFNSAECIGSPLMASVLAETVVDTGGICHEDESNTSSYSLSVSPNGIASLSYDCDLGCTSCAAEIESDLVDPQCTILPVNGSNVTLAFLLVLSTAIPHSLQMAPPPPPPSPPAPPTLSLAPTSAPPSFQPSHISTSIIVAVSIASALIVAAGVVAMWPRRRADMGGSIGINNDDLTVTPGGEAVTGWEHCANSVDLCLARAGASIVSVVGSCTRGCSAVCIGTVRACRRLCSALLLVVALFGAGLVFFFTFWGSCGARVNRYFDNPQQPAAVMASTKLMLALSSVVTAGECVLWAYKNPFDHFTEGIFQEVGLSSSSLSATTVIDNFQMWSKCGLYGCAVLSGTCLMCVLKIVLTGTLKWVTPMLGLAVIGFFGGLLLPPFTFFFRDGFKLNPSVNSTFIRSDPAIVNGIEEAIGTGFATVAFSWYSVIFTFATGGICFGTFFAAVLFCTQDRKYGADDETSTLVSLEAGRITVLVWLAHLMAPLVQLLSVVILYQLTGQSTGFLLFWLALWGLPMVYVWKFSNVVRHATSTGLPPPTKVIGYIFAVYIITFVVVNIVLLCSLGSLTSQYNVAFFFTLTLSSALALGTLSFMTLNSEFEADRALIHVNIAESEDSSSVESEAGDALGGTNETSHIARSHVALDVDRVQFCSFCGCRLGPTSHDLIYCSACGKELPRLHVQAELLSAIVPTGHDRGSDDMAPEERQIETRPSLGGQILTTIAAVQIVKDPQLTGAGNALWAFLNEKEEQLRPRFYGKRLPHRRIFLIVAIICLGVVLFTNWKDHQNESPEDAVKAMLFTADKSLVWPTNGTALDNLLTSYQHARDASDDVCLVGWGVLLASIFVEPLMDPSRGLAVAQVMSSLSMVLLFFGLTIPAYPNYVAEINIHLIIPECAPEFDDFVDHLVRNGVGLLCSGYFAVALFVVLLAISPALVRVSKMMALDGTLDTWKTFNNESELRIFKRNILVILAWGSLLAPLLCCLPMLIFFQFLGDLETGLCFIAFTLLPIIAAFTARAETVTQSYFLYLGFYFLPLLVVLLIESKKHHLSGVIIKNLKDPMTYLEFLAEIALANVAVSDILYVSLH